MVEYANHSSFAIYASSGVPQGSILGTLLSNNGVLKVLDVVQQFYENLLFDCEDLHYGLKSFSYWSVRMKHCLQNAK